jgi:autotransporter-associated beta strand protein
LSSSLRLAAFFIWVVSANAFAQTWNGTTYPTSNWSIPANWTGGLPSNDGTANVIFKTGPTITDAYLDTSWNIGTLTFSGSGNTGSTLDITGSSTNPATLTIQNGLTCSLTLTDQALPPPYNVDTINLSLGSFQTWNISTELYVESAISGPGGIDLTGGGLLYLASGNTYTGGTTINSGTVSAVDDTSFGNLSGQLQLNGGTLRFDFINNAPPTSFTRSIVLGTTGGTILFKRAVNISSAISGNGPLALASESNSAPPLTLSGQSSFTGGLSLLNGIYQPDGGENWPVTASGANQSLGNGPVSVGEGVALSIDAASNLGAGNAITLHSGSGLIVTSDSFDPTPLIDPSSTQAYLDLGGSTYNRALNLAALGDGSLTLGVASGQSVTYGASSLQPGTGNVYRLGGDLNQEDSNLVIGGYDNVLTGNASVDIKGSVELLNANNYTGNTVLNSGVAVGSDQSLGTGTVLVQGGGIRSLNGTRIIGNSITFSGSFFNGGFEGPLILNGPVDLGGGAVTQVNIMGSVTFANVISDGTLELTGGTAILRASNTFSTLDLFEATASVASESNLGGPNTPIVLDGTPNGPTTCGTLEATASFTLNNPISFNFNPTLQNAYATFQVDPGVTLTLNDNIPAGTFYKTGLGTLAFTGNSPQDALIVVYAGTVTSTGYSLGGANVIPCPGGTFAGTGQLGFLGMNGGIAAPGGGVGEILADAIAFGNDDGPPVSNTLQFQFSQQGSPNYANLSNSGNGLINFNHIGSNSTFTGTTISIFLSSPNLQIGNSFQGAFFINSSGPISPTFFNGATFNYYVLSPTGTTTFNGQTYAPLNLSHCAVTQSWVAEAPEDAPVGPGQVMQFQLTSATASGLDTWASRFFTAPQLLDSTVSGPGAAPENDGVPNILKYLCDINPALPMSAAGRAALPAFTVANGNLTLTYRQNSSETGINVIVQTSPDLQNWSTITPTSLPVADTIQQIGTDPNTNDPIYQIQVPASGTREFIRLNLTQ